MRQESFRARLPPSRLPQEVLASASRPAFAAPGTSQHWPEKSREASHVRGTSSVCGTRGTARAGLPPPALPPCLAYGGSHACRRLLPRPPGPHLDRGHVRIRAGNTREPGRHRTPASSPIHAGHAAKDAGGDQRTRSHARKHQPWGSLGQRLV